MGQQERVGFIGVGMMGRPMVLRLLKAGFQVAVWGRDPAKLQDVVSAGATIADSPAQLAMRSDIVLLCVANTAAVEAVVDGDHGLAKGLGAGKLVIDMSTIDAAVTRRLAQRLRKETGAGWIDAPVSGGPPGAAAGTLAVMAGGDQADFERSKSVVKHLAGRYTLMGGVGAGQTTKMINQVIVGGCKAVIAEAVQLAMNSGIDPLRLPEAFEGGRADSSLLRQSVPKMASGDFSPTGHLRTIMKDLDMVLELARATRTPMPMTALATELHRMMMVRGHGEADTTSVIALLRDRPLL
ncbi:MAG: NAD(P)-dependent oxidoreductase [Burkholderiales bacterium]|nr:MAG: NAD(P)-dependent oxidoreductase [Burkholderiales bacterium]